MKLQARLQKTPELPPIPWTLQEGDSIVSFELHRTDIAESLMQPLPIIEHLDELEDVRPGLIAGVIVAIMHELILQRAEEAFLQLG